MLALTFFLSPKKRKSHSIVSGFAESIRPVQSNKFSRERRTILPLLGERAGARADVILAFMILWLHPKVWFHAIFPKLYWTKWHNSCIMF